tara:strand:- start:361 stop:525 length:165 start_codon:yes stop_codon:yes gene_type:complete
VKKMIGTEEATDVAKGARIMQLVKENRIEAMVITILLYSTGLLEKAVTYGQGVC